MANSVQLEASEAWRKAGFFVRPYHGHDEEDAKRFHKEILMALDGEMLSVSSGINYTMGDVARGDDTGGSNNPAVGAAATVATINRAHAVRARHVLQKINKHILNPDTKEKMDTFRTDAQPAEAALAWFVANECGGATPAPRVNDYKHEMRTLTIIGEAGYRVGSINSFSNARQKPQTLSFPLFRRLEGHHRQTLDNLLAKPYCIPDL